LREDFHLKFPGFSGFQSRCHVRVLAESKKPMVVICSQVKTEPGTSIMNAYEIIRGHVFDYLAKKQSEKLRHDTATELEGFAETIEKTRKLRVALVAYLLRFAARALTNRVPMLDQINREEPELYWIEHWPKGTGLGEDVDYLLVSENEVGEPHWQRVNFTKLAERLGYCEADFEIPDEAVA